MRSPPVSRSAAQVALPPGSFLQATVAGEETLAALVSALAKRGKYIADLFCGVGPFALRLAAKSRLPPSTAMPARSQRCRRRANIDLGLKPIKAEPRDLFRRPLMPQELRDYDDVVFDPPRAGRAGASDAARREQDVRRWSRFPATSRHSPRDAQAS
jgi:23S rRNA (uracil1939-C5)-methyltransferase